MEIIVLIKQVPDVVLNIKVKDGEIVDEGLSYVISSWDETALEAGLQITEDVGGEVTLLTVGPDKAAESLRKGLAMGAHKAVHIKYDQAVETDSFAYAKILQKALEGRKYDLVLTGKQSQDTDAGLTAYIFTDDQIIADNCANKLRFGEIQINGVKYGIDLPHIGIKQSGIGCDCSHLALNDYLVIKRVTQSLS